MSDGVFGTERPSVGGEGETFPQHPKTGSWESLKGTNISPWLQTVDKDPDNEGPDRLNQTVTGVQGWDKSLKPREAPTGPGGTLAK